MSEFIKCEYCGRVVKKSKWEIGRAKHHFCSIECHNKWQGKWSDEEKELLRKVYPTSSKEELLRLFPNRTYYSIKRMASLLGLKKQKYWTEERKKLLRELYQKEIPPDEVYKHFPERSKKAIQMMAERLGVIRPSRSTKYFKSKPSPELCYILGVLYGDGYAVSLKRGTSYVGLETIDKEFAMEFAECLRKIGLNPLQYTRKRRNQKIQYGVRAHSTPFVRWFKNLTFEELKKIVSEYPEDFIRGFYDSEGFLCKRHSDGTYTIGMCNTDYKIISLVKALLERRGYHPRLEVRRQNSEKVFIVDHWAHVNKREIYYLWIGRREDIKKFMRNVKPIIKRKRLEEH